MNKEVVEEWVSELRSGKYEQGKGRLNFADSFCCLGVLCELAVKHGVIGPPELTPTEGMSYDGQLGYLPIKVMKWAGINVNNGEYKQGNLTDKNDSGVSFSEIADIIESNPPGLFVEESDGNNN